MWLARCTFLFALFLAQFYVALSGKESVWKNPLLVGSLINVFVNNLQRSGVFTVDQMEDIQSIETVVLNAMEELDQSNANSRSRVSALNAVFASAVAEICASAGAGSQHIASVQNELSNAFLQLTGSVDEAFVNEVLRLITVFTNVDSSFDSTAETASDSSSFVESPESNDWTSLIYGNPAAGAIDSDAASFGINSQTGAEYYTSSATSLASSATQAASFSLDSTTQTGANNVVGSLSRGTAVASDNTNIYRSGAISDISRVGDVYGIDLSGASGGRFAYSSLGGANALTGVDASSDLVSASSAATVGNAYSGSSALSSVSTTSGPLFGSQSESSLVAGSASASSSAIAQGYGATTANAGYVANFVPDASALAPGYNFSVAAGNTGYVANSVPGAFETYVSSRLSAPRISTAASSMASGGIFSPDSVSSVLSNIISQIGASDPSSSRDEIIIQALYEVIVALVHILNYSYVGIVDVSNASSTANSITYAVQNALY